MRVSERERERERESKRERQRVDLISAKYPHLLCTMPTGRRRRNIAAILKSTVR